MKTEGVHTPVTDPVRSDKPFRVDAPFEPEAPWGASDRHENQLLFESCHEETHAVQQRTSLLDGLGGLHNSRQPDREGRAFARLARNRDFAAHHLTEIASPSPVPAEHRP